MLSMIVVKAGVERIEGLMILIRVAEEKTHCSPKTELLLKINTFGKGARRKIPTHEANIRFLISGLERVCSHRAH